MGYILASYIEPAMRYLLALLKQERSVIYSRFYDGTEECATALRASLWGGNEPESTTELSPAVLIDLAVEQLERQGVVKTTELDDRLADGEPDYRIELVEGEPPRTVKVWDMDL